MAVRRIILIVVSTIVGVASVPILFIVLNALYDVGVDLERFGIGYAFLWGTPIGLAVGVWLDYFLGTNVLPE